MLVGVAEIELLIPTAESLKEKRFVLESIKKRLRNRFNISIAEVGNTEKWQRANLGIALVSNEGRFIEKVFTQIINFIEIDDRVEIIQFTRDVY
ncbi:DUF503 domain-containing protein [bacterium]|nr:DUF503 domain-containing protein [bacterium]